MAVIDRRVGGCSWRSPRWLVIAMLQALDFGILQGPSLQRDAATQQVTLPKVPAARGTITDRNGVQLTICWSWPTM